ncbi:Fis family transcriptional regulator [Thermoplasma sp. Kam2015]|uniref:SCP2 sterol-binding domain-containing protein n=1 Tax=Thermoplasma sp. Kam2015 TaxID=2094122 RepID=UPI000D817CDD|nr:SCP2 sterol-binding domain-containing protein [Thermoplasma sp. Kam2015]PYB68247.1 Fis family transcriptional regulator [Thermoplasma sp. Kam2015]
MAEEILFPSQTWVDEYCRRLSESPDYNKAGKGWKDPIMFTISDTGSLSEKPEFGSFTLYLRDGKCEKCEVIKEGEGSAPFVLTATYANWRKIIDGKINPTQAMLTGQLKVKGNMALILRYASAAIAMVKVAQSIPTKYLA